MPNIKHYLFASLMLGLSQSGMAGGIEQLRAYIQGTQSLRAEFQQVVSGSRKTTRQEASGNVSIQRPGKFRWVYAKPYEQLVVGDGQKLWLYDKDLAQVTVKRLDQALGSSPAALLAGSNDLEKSFKLRDIGANDGLEWLEATPKGSDSTFEWVKMGFTNNELKVVELRDNFGQTTVIRLSKLEHNPKLDSSQFKFSPPAGVDVVGD
jgi:outer membrane lipoprotein carrier protein